MEDDLDQARFLEEVVVIAPKTKTTAQCTPRGAPAAPTSARRARTHTNGLGLCKCAISCQRVERRRHNTRPMQPRALRRHGTVRCVKSRARSSRGRWLRFAYRLAETFRSSSSVGRLGKSSSQRSVSRREVALLHGLQREATERV